MGMFTFLMFILMIYKKIILPYVVNHWDDQMVRIYYLIHIIFKPSAVKPRIHKYVLQWSQENKELGS